MEAEERIGRYRVERVIATGSFGTVFLARDEDLDVPIAVKVLADNWARDEDFARRFLDEARIMRRLNDERIAQVYAVDRLPDGRPYIVMEYADLGSLADRMSQRFDEGPPYSIAEALAISREIAQCLMVAHALDVIHRDLKPSNILYRSVARHRQQAMVREGRASVTEQMLLADFGIARRLEAARAFTVVAGTPLYMAPEQSHASSAARADKRSDVYSAAVILYELLAGQPPFTVESAGVLQVADRSTYRELASWRRDAPPALDEVVSKALALDPDDRHASAEEWEMALRAVEAENEASAAARVTIARVPSPPIPERSHEPTARPARRKTRGPLVAAAAIVIVLVAGAALVALTRGGAPTTTAGTTQPRAQAPPPLPALEIDDPVALAADPAGVIHVADRHVIGKLSGTTFVDVAGARSAGVPGDGVPALAASIDSPTDLAFDADGNLYISEGDGARVRTVQTDGVIRTFAGTGGKGDAGDGGSATAAEIAVPWGVAAGTDGSVYIADTESHRIRRVLPDGTITTYAGTGKHGYAGDGGAARTAQLNNPRGIVLDKQGNLYVADRENYRIRKIDANGNIATIAGTGASDYTGDGAPAGEATFRLPSALALSESGDLYVGDEGNNVVRKIASDGTITTVAGNGDRGVGGDGGPAQKAQLDSPSALALDTAGNLYIVDKDNDRVRRVGSDGTITTVAGHGGAAPPTAKATEVDFDSVADVATAPGGVVYAVDRLNHRVVKITPDGNAILMAGTGRGGFSGDGGGATEAQLAFPSGIAIDASGRVFVADVGNHRIRRIDTDATIETVAGTGTPGFGPDSGPATEAPLNFPFGIAVDASGDLYIADTANHRIRRVRDGKIATIAGTGENGWSGDGGPAVAAQLDAPVGVAVGPNGAIYVSDRQNRRIRRIDRGGTITTIAGTGTAGFTGDGGPAEQAQITTPGGIFVDAGGALYIADQGNDRIRRIDRSGVITSVAGSGGRSFAGDGGPAIEADLHLPSSVAVDASGTIYISDERNDRVRAVDASANIRTVAGR